MTLPTIPGLPQGSQPPLSNSQAGNSTNEIPGLPNYSDMPTSGSYTTTAVPGTPEWYQQELGGLYGQPILLGIQPHHVPTGKGADAAENRGVLPKAATDVTQKTEEIYRQFVSLAASDPSQFAQYQALLYDGGFYGATPRASVHWGMLTDADTAAIKDAMAQYLRSTQADPNNPSPLTWISKDPAHPGFLDGRAMLGRQNQAQGGVGGAGGSGTTPPQVSLTDPSAIRMAAQQAAQAALGQGLSDDQLSQFVSQFQAAQTSAQSSTAGSVTEPDLQADAMQFAQQVNPDQYQGHQAQGYMNALLDLFLPSASQRPNITPVPRAGGAEAAPTASEATKG